LCGIVGLLDVGQRLDLRGVVMEMADCIAHRGPDDSGVWNDGAAGVSLGFRRLAILDLSSEGAQPMISHDQRWVIVFNGEIYNYREIRGRLDAASPRSWRGHSDTEVLLEAIAEWCPQKALESAEGMFAIALWDRRDRRLLLARDRFGEKPLYYGWVGGVFVFGSELKALRRVPGFEDGLDCRALAEYLRYGHVSQPRSIYAGIRKLAPGCWIALEGRVIGEEPSPTAYWSAYNVIARARARPLELSEPEAVERLDHSLRRAVALRMEADVPLGSFLSGGLDSSTVAACMQANSPGQVRTFTIGTDDKHLNEAPYAKAIAEYLGTDHTELYVPPGAALELVPRLAEIYDEPFADSSQIPTYIISRLAREHLTVALTGDGGDELFGGYSRHFTGEPVWSAIERLPRPLRRPLAGAIHLVSPAVWEAAIGALGPLLPAAVSAPQAGERMHRLAAVLASQTSHDFYRNLIAHWRRLPTSAATEVDSYIDGIEVPPGVDRFADQAMYFDTVFYLPEDILTKVDRAAMAVSLETRAPFLDRELFELAWSLPSHMRVHHGQGKYILRRVLERYIPNRLFDRPKKGFAVPVGTWLREELRDWAEGLLSERKLREFGVLDVRTVRRTWNEHQGGRRDCSTRLWIVLMLQAWLEDQRRPLRSHAAELHD